MITTDKITVKVGDKVWRIDYDEVAEGVITQSDESWTTVKWLSESDYHASLEPFSHQYGDVNGELFGSESNAIQVLIYRTSMAIKEHQELVDSLIARLKELK